MHKVITQDVFILNPKYCSVFWYNSFGSAGIPAGAHIPATTASPEDCKTPPLETLQGSLHNFFLYLIFLWESAEHSTETWICSPGIAVYSLLNGCIKVVTNRTERCQ